jgi:hypothetical protein
VIGSSSQVSPPSAEFRTKTLFWPLASSEAHTTWTPFSSAATAELVKNLENVNPLSQANGPSPQSTVPVAPANWFESNSSTEATLIGSPNETPPSLELRSQTSAVGRALDGYVK